MSFLPLSDVLIELDTDLETCIILLYNFHVVPGTLQNLMCSNLMHSDLTLSWNPPTSQRSEIVGYRVDVKQLAHRDGTREVVQSEVVTFTATKTEANITQGLGMSIRCPT